MKNSIHAHAALLVASLLTSSAVSAKTFPELAIKEMPVTCRLLPSELREREATLLTDLRKQIVQANSLANGYALSLNYGRGDEPSCHQRNHD